VKQKAANELSAMTRPDARRCLTAPKGNLVALLKTLWLERGWQICRLHNTSHASASLPRIANESTDSLSGSAEAVRNVQGAVLSPLVIYSHSSRTLAVSNIGKLRLLTVDPFQPVLRSLRHLHMSCEQQWVHAV
jgi:hypothetical protein